MNEIWQKYAPYWHICTAAIAAVIACVFWLKDVSAYDQRITDNELATEKVVMIQEKQQRVITRMDYNIQIIARKIGVKPLEKAGDE